MHFPPMQMFLKSSKLQRHLTQAGPSLVGIPPPSRAAGRLCFVCVCTPPTPGTPGSSYPERSFSITIFCSPAEMLLLPEPGVEARSLVPGSCPLPGVLSAVWTSLRIRGRGPSLDMMLCEDTEEGGVTCWGHWGRPRELQPLCLKMPEE